MIGIGIAQGRVVCKARRMYLSSLDRYGILGILNGLGNPYGLEFGISPLWVSRCLGVCCVFWYSELVLFVSLFFFV